MKKRNNTQDFTFLIQGDKLVIAELETDTKVFGRFLGTYTCDKATALRLQAFGQDILTSALKVRE